MIVIRSIAGRHCDSALSMPQLRALGFLRRYPDQPLSWLAEQLGLTVSATSRLVNGLVLRDLISRNVPPENRRKVALSLTPKGLEVLGSTIVATQAELAEKLASLSPEQQASVIAGMDVLRNILGPWGRKPEA